MAEEFLDHGELDALSVRADDLAVSMRWQDPYGVARGPAPAAWPDKHGFLNGYQNTTGLVHLGARDYDPGTGRFVTVDPVLNAGDTQQMNGYTYADANPVANSDPSGLEPLSQECAQSDMVACREYYYGNWNVPSLQNINLSLAIATHWHSAKMSEYGILATRQAEKKFHPTREQIDNSWRSLIGVASALTGPETGGASVLGCSALAGAGGGAADAMANDENVYAAVAEGGLLGFLEGIAGVGVAKLLAKAAAPVEEAPVLRPSAACNSFAGATPVLMADGTSKPIAEVQGVSWQPCKPRVDQDRLS
ncbi:MAG TPA: RHS repeat-associated core domain-containing protein [Propionibacteriaceae bacterium]|nr:RHS repeat-associated core domain-containing protein [Propionibacteriaceae bacterium]